jgi:hypothetical protein
MNKIASVLAAAALLTVATVTPALANTTPAMTANNGSVNIAVLGPENSLSFFWATNGSPYWNPGTVAKTNTTFSAPVVAVSGNTVDIAAGPQGQLMFYWAVNGTSTWHPETIVGPGSVG